MRKVSLIAAAALLAAAGCKDDRANRGRTSKEQALRATRAQERERRERGARERRDKAKAVAALKISEGRSRRGPIGRLVSDPSGDPRKVVADAVKRRGGLKKLKALKVVSGRHHLVGPVLGPKTRRYVWRLPGAFRLEFVGALNEVRRGVIIDGTKGVAFSRTGLRPLKPSELEMYRQAMYTDPAVALPAAMGPGARLKYLGRAKVRGEMAHVVRFTGRRGRVVELYVGVENADVLAYRYNGHQGLTTVLQSGFKEQGGIRIATVNDMLIRGARVRVTVDQIRLNPKVPPDTFNTQKNPL